MQTAPDPTTDPADGDAGDAGSDDLTASAAEDGAAGGEPVPASALRYLRTVARTCLVLGALKMLGSIAVGGVKGISYHWALHWNVVPTLVFETDAATLAEITAWSTMLTSSVAVALLVVFGLRAPTHDRYLGSAIGMLSVAEIIVIDSVTVWRDAPDSVLGNIVVSIALFVIGMVIVAVRLARGGPNSRLFPHLAAGA